MQQQQQKMCFRPEKIWLFYVRGGGGRHCRKTRSQIPFTDFFRSMQHWRSKLNGITARKRKITTQRFMVKLAIDSLISKNPFEMREIHVLPYSLFPLFFVSSTEERGSFQTKSGLRSKRATGPHLKCKRSPLHPYRPLPHPKLYIDLENTFKANNIRIISRTTAFNGFPFSFSNFGHISTRHLFKLKFA